MSSHEQLESSDHEAAQSPTGRWGDVIYIAQLVPKFKELMETAVRVSRLGGVWVHQGTRVTGRTRNYYWLFRADGHLCLHLLSHHVAMRSRNCISNGQSRRRV